MRAGNSSRLQRGKIPAGYLWIGNQASVGPKAYVANPKKLGFYYKKTSETVQKEPCNLWPTFDNVKVLASELGQKRGFQTAK